VNPELQALVAKLDARPIPEDWPVRTDLAALLAEGIPQTQFVDAHGLLPEAARVLGVGATESGKSMWASWMGAQLSRGGLDVAYFSEENPLTEDLRRLGRLRPDLERFRFFHGQGVDLLEEGHVQAILATCEGCGLVVFDTLSSCWPGDENDNSAIAELDRRALAPLARAGATVLVLDHTGHPQAFVSRRGVHAPRGASAKAQKVDVLLEFRATGASEFRVEVAKYRVGGLKPPAVTCRVVDTLDDGLDIELVVGAADPRTVELAERMVAAIEAAGELGQNQLRAAVGGGRENQDVAMRLLSEETPRRVIVADGPRRSKLWVPAEGSLI
jgi:hypothetical protein